MPTIKQIHVMRLVQKILCIIYFTLFLGLALVFLLSITKVGIEKGYAVGAPLILFFFFFFMLAKKNPSKDREKVFVISTKIILVLQFLLTLPALLIFTWASLAEPLRTGDEGAWLGVFYTGVLTLISGLFMILFWVNLFAFETSPRSRRLFLIFPILTLVVPSTIFLAEWNFTDKEDNKNTETEVTQATPVEETEQATLYSTDPKLLASKVYQSCSPLLKNSIVFEGVTDEKFDEAVTLLDDENLYLEMTAGQFDGSVTCTIFLKPDQGQIVAYTVNLCGPICAQIFQIYEEVDEKWVASTDLLPDVGPELSALSKQYEDFNPLYVLPRYGTTIQIIEQYSHDILLELEWEKDHFKVL